MEIRHFEAESDARAVIRVNALAWREAYDDVLPAEVLEQFDPEPSAHRVEQRYDALVADRDGVLVAEDDEGVVRGYVYLRWGEETKAFVGETEAGLKELYVDPDYWNGGIGTALLDAGLELLPSSVTAVTLEMLSGNDVGQRFYRARGFEQVATAEYDVAGQSYPTVVYTRDL